MTETVLLTVRGEAVLEAEPELAAVTVTLAAQDRDRPQVVARLDAAVAALGAMLDRYPGAVDVREFGSVSVLPEGERKRSGFSGSARVILSVVDFALLGELVSYAAGDEGVSLGGVRWTLSPDSPVYARARRAALADAAARARDYAEALDATVVRLVEVADEGLTSGLAWQGARVEGVAYAASGSGSFAGAAYGKGSGPGMEPQRQRIRAVVEARYTLSPPHQN
ncbi:SIMPL domain-containing protein [Longispora sp. NPDC051575]|uniref:SIMPL domain-containing protein n=1 Tax=Longispora sp. NPDC051575 TaxID=3154943 RepID=UPI003417C710